MIVKVNVLLIKHLKGTKDVHIIRYNFQLLKRDKKENKKLCESVFRLLSYTLSLLSKEREREKKKPIKFPPNVHNYV